MKDEINNEANSAPKTSKSRRRVGLFGMIFDFIRDFSATSAATGLIIVLAVVVAVIGKGGGGGSSDAPSDSQTFTVSPEKKMVLDTDLIEMYDEELRERAAIPTCSRYDDAGRPVVELIRDDSGNVTSVACYEYRDDGTLLTEKKYSPSGAIVEKIVYASREMDCVKAVFTVSYDESDTLKGYTLSDMDLSGVVQKKTEYTPTGVLKSYSRFEYSDDGKASRETVYSPYDTVICYYEYSYDDKGRVSDRIQYDEASDTYVGTSWVYDVLGRVVRESYYNGDVCYAYNEYAYNDDGTYTMAAYYLTDQATMKYEKTVISN